jgi:hypothetical protein
MHAISKPARHGTAPVAFLATEPQIKGGTYYNRFTPAQSSAASHDLAASRRLWDITKQLRGPFGRQ